MLGRCIGSTSVTHEHVLVLGSSASGGYSDEITETGREQWGQVTQEQEQEQEQHLLCPMSQIKLHFLSLALFEKV